MRRGARARTQATGRTRGWVCLGRMAYNIDDAKHHAQELWLAGYYGLAPFRIDRAVVRVLDNHGAPYSCLYQIRLEGWGATASPWTDEFVRCIIDSERGVVGRFAFGRGNTPSVLTGCKYLLWKLRAQTSHLNRRTAAWVAACRSRCSLRRNDLVHPGSGHENSPSESDGC